MLSPMEHVPHFSSSDAATAHLLSPTTHSKRAQRHAENTMTGAALLSDSSAPSTRSSSLAPSSTAGHEREHLSRSPSAGFAFPASNPSSISGLSSSTVSYASAPSDAHCLSTRRQREQRRLLNRLAVYLPKPLRPLASSTARFCTALAFSVLCMLLFSSSLLSSHPLPLSSLSASSSSVLVPLGRTFQSSTEVKRDGSISRMSDSTDQRQQQLLSHHQDQQRLTQPEKWDSGRVHEDSLHESENRATPPAKKEISRSNKDCVPDGFLRGVDAFRESGPTSLFRDNMRKDLKYMTFGMTNGFTSQFTELANGIYLAKLSDRVPVLPPFASAAHEDRKEAGYLSFSKVFDLPYLETMLRHPVQEWSNLKITAEEASGLGEDMNPQFKDDKLRAKALSKVKRERISCWSLWAAQMPDIGKPAGSAVQNHLGLDINYWPVPLSFSNPPKDRHVRYWDLVMLDKDINAIKSDHLFDVAQSERSDVAAKLPSPPDDQLMCFDTLYYTAATGPEEWWQPHAPVWKAVGRYARFNEDVRNLAEGYLRALLDVDKDAKVPEFISVHMRRGTAKRICKNNKDCLPQFEGYRRAVNRVRDAILEARGVYVRWVIVTTDERDPAFLDSIEALGWAVVDHTELQTKESYGSWWEVVVDSAIQSKGSGFVGTERSGMSLVAGRRVEEWNKGPCELVKWGHKGAAV